MSGTERVRFDPTEAFTSPAFKTGLQSSCINVSWPILENLCLICASFACCSLLKASCEALTEQRLRFSPGVLASCP